MATSSAALILAAGQGTRMRSALPKVLHPCAELPLVAHVVRLALAHGCDPVVVVVSPATAAAVEAKLTALFPDAALRFAVQAAPRGTGDAAHAGLQVINAHRGPVLVLYGDVPLLQPATLTALADAATAAAAPLAFLTAQVDDPTGYGRVVRDAAGRVQAIVEHRDASAEQRAVREINAGVYRVDAALLREAVTGLSSANAQGELYLTDIVALAAARGGACAVRVADRDEIRGVNSRAELAVAEALCHRRLVAEHQARGVTFHDPMHTAIGADVVIEADVDVGVGVQLYGRTRIAAGARIEGPSVLRDVTLGPRSHVLAFSHLEQATLGEGAVAGPFARLRPGAQLDARARVGNFVEVKKAHLGAGAKANHLAYVGDAEIGPGANLGAGTITCNYDGFAKHRTHVGAGAFVGSNSALVAPVEVAAGAIVAAGSTITRDVPADALAFGRAQQVNREGHAEALRTRLRAAAAAGTPSNKER